MEQLTSKRFNRVGGYVYDGDRCISHFEDVTHRDDIVKLLNELHEENKELKEKNENLLAKLKYTCEQINYSERLREMME